MEARRKLPDAAKEQERQEEQAARKERNAKLTSQSRAGQQKCAQWRECWKEDQEKDDFKDVLVARIAAASAGVSGGSITDLKEAFKCPWTSLTSMAIKQGIVFKVAPGGKPPTPKQTIPEGHGWPVHARVALAAWKTSKKKGVKG
jgi:hypothetical protein